MVGCISLENNNAKMEEEGHGGGKRCWQKKKKTIRISCHNLLGSNTWNAQRLVGCHWIPKPIPGLTITAGSFQCGAQIRHWNKHLKKTGIISYKYGKWMCFYCYTNSKAWSGLVFNRSWMGVTALDDASCPTALGQIRVDGSSMFGFKSIEARFPCPPRQEWPKTPQPPSPLDLAPALNEQKKGRHEKCIFNLVNERLTSALRQMERAREKKKDKN